MNIKQLRIYMTLCRNNFSVGKTAETLLISPATVSRAISELEAEFGVDFFLRRTRQLQITDTGILFMRDAERILHKYALMEKDFCHNDNTSSIRIGVSSLFGSTLLPDCLRKFSSQCPSVPIHARLYCPSEIEDYLQRGDVDLAIVDGVPANSEFSCIPFNHTSLVAVASPDYPVPYNSVTIAELLTYPLLVNEPDCGARLVLDNTLERMNLHLDPLWESNNTLILIDAAAKGIGVSIVIRELAEPAIITGKVRTVEISDVNLSNVTTILHNRSTILTQPMESFISIITEASIASHSARSSIDSTTLR